MSVRIRMLSTGEVREVTNNVAFDLIDSGKAETFDAEKERLRQEELKRREAERVEREERKRQAYLNRQMQSEGNFTK